MTFSKNDIDKYISNSSQVKEMYRLAMDCGFWPDFPNYRIEKFCDYLEAAKIGNIDNVDDIISQNISAIKNFIAEIYSYRKNGWDWRLNSVFLCELVLIFKFPEIFNFDYLTKHDWDKEIAQIVLEAAENNA
jgi:hypothetical protein